MKYIKLYENYSVSQVNTIQDMVNDNKFVNSVGKLYNSLP
jgi:hypothetical protein